MHECEPVNIHHGITYQALYISLTRKIYSLNLQIKLQNRLQRKAIVFAWQRYVQRAYFIRISNAGLCGFEKKTVKREMEVLCLSCIVKQTQEI